VLSEEVGKLYKKIKADPQSYPRGLTVRILLGNYPVISNLEWGSQIWDALGDLREAGVEKMVDPQIGWRLEIANYAGVYPHSHTKFLVVDGRLVMAAGFNYGYLHFAKDHPSGKGYDLLDLGLVVLGPVGQDVLGVYDDMWNGADQVHCENLNPPDGSDWRDTCQELKATPSHLPEVLRAYLPPEGNANSFSLYRSIAYKLGDEFIATSLAAASESIDMMEVNFSLEMICMLNLVFPDVCTIDNALPWMDAVLDAIENNGAKLRVIMENTNSNGMENRVAGRVLLDELERRGLSDHAELRFYSGKIHAKSVLFDDQFLIIGSQNMHYSSWGERGLNEFSVSTDDPGSYRRIPSSFRR
jgi:phosphatidylserine/phosphatidylglycerophosphate/cardiolipin synthase-like enzyme